MKLRLVAAGFVWERCDFGFWLGFGGGLGRALCRELLLGDVFELSAPIEVFDEASAGAPLFLHFDEEFEEDARAEQRFDLLAGGRADTLEHVAGAADDDGFLAGALDKDGGGNFSNGKFAVAGFFCTGGWIFPALDDDGGGVGDLFAGQHEDFFADEFGDEEALGLIGDLVLGEVALAFWEEGDDLVEQEVEALFLAGGDGDDVAEVVEARPVRDEREQVLLGDGVDFIEDEEDGAVEALDQRESEVIFGGGKVALAGGEGLGAG